MGLWMKTLTFQTFGTLRHPTITQLIRIGKFKKKIKIGLFSRSAYFRWERIPSFLTNSIITSINDHALRN